MNFFQFAQSSKGLAKSPFTSAPTTLNIPPNSAQIENKYDIEKSNIPQLNDLSSIDNGITNNSNFLFSPKKVTFLKPQSEISNDITSMKSNSDNILQQTKQHQVSLKPPQPTEVANVSLVAVEMTTENIEKHIERLENGFKMVASWAQSQLELLQKIEEQIENTKVDTCHFIAEINSFLNK